MDNIIHKPAHDDVAARITVKKESLKQVLALAVQAARAGNLKTVVRPERNLCGKTPKA